MDATARAAAAATSKNWHELEALARSDPDASVRATALAALVNHGPRPLSAGIWRGAVGDPDARVRLRAAQVAPRLGRAARNDALLTLLADDDAWVAEAAAYAI